MVVISPCSFLIEFKRKWFILHKSFTGVKDTPLFRRSTFSDIWSGIEPMGRMLSRSWPVWRSFIVYEFYRITHLNAQIWWRKSVFGYTDSIYCSICFSWSRFHRTVSGRCGSGYYYGILGVPAICRATFLYWERITAIYVRTAVLRIFTTIISPIIWRILTGTAS